MPPSEGRDAWEVLNKLVRTRERLAEARKELADAEADDAEATRDALAVFEANDFPRAVAQNNRTILLVGQPFGGKPLALLVQDVGRIPSSFALKSPFKADPAAGWDAIETDDARGPVEAAEPAFAAA